jgi:hypothetical protein
MIKVTILGLAETQAMFDNIIKNSSSAGKEVLTEISNLLVSTAKTNAHVISGNMKNNISSKVSDKVATVTAAANYSAIENARPGSKSGSTHNFMDRAVETVRTNLPSILKKHSSKWTGGK